MTDTKLTTVKLTPYTENNPPKVGDTVLVSENSWYKPYRNQQKEVTGLDLQDACIWLQGDETYPAGVLESIHLLQKVEVVHTTEPEEAPKRFTVDNQPAVGEACILVDADGSEPLLEVVGREVVVEEQMDSEGHLYVKLPEGNSHDFDGYYVDIWQLSPSNKGDTKMTTKQTAYSEDNRPKIGDKVVLLPTTEEGLEYAGQIFTVLRDDFDTCPILIDFPEYSHGLFVHLRDIEPAQTSDDTQSETISAYDLPCDFKVGDRVTCLLFGDGVVTDDSSSDKYPISVSYDAGGSNEYTEEGNFYSDTGKRLLFHAGTVKLVVNQEAVNKLAAKYVPQYKRGQMLYAAKDGKVTGFYVEKDEEKQIVSESGVVFPKVEHNPEGYAFYEEA
jgi:hypothetical protein